MGFFQAVATDLDGTLTTGEVVPAEVMAVLASLRLESVRSVLVTGRTRAELERSFPGLASTFDAVVAENGAVLTTYLGSRLLALPIEGTLELALSDRGIHMVRGEVLLACSADHSATVAEEIGRLGLDAQLIHNRAALMVLPAGVSKGTGLRAALAELGLSAHNTIAVGDAENDLALLEVAEVGVAVANAVPSLRAHADLVLNESSAEGVNRLLKGPLLSGTERFCPARRWLQIGTFDDGSPTLLPGSQANILITGQSGYGKSYLGGLMVEAWMQAEYRVLVIDPEGDHSGLTQLPGMFLVGGNSPLPAPAEVVDRLISNSVVLDLSQLGSADKVRYSRRILEAADLSRTTRGIPHWVLIDEAHLLMPDPDFAAQLQRLACRGEALVTFQPEALPDEVAKLIDITMSVPATDQRHGTWSRSSPRATLEVEGRVRSFTAASRRTRHTRHRRKYANAELSPHQRFYFHTSESESVVSAANLTEFVSQLGSVHREVVAYHLARGDFSRWIAGTLQDSRLSQHIAIIEHDAQAAQALNIEHARQRLTEAVSTRYFMGADVGPQTVIDLTDGVPLEEAE